LRKDEKQELKIKEEEKLIIPAALNQALSQQEEDQEQDIPFRNLTIDMQEAEKLISRYTTRLIKGGLQAPEAREIFCPMCQDIYNKFNRPIVYV
jgi:hypothetical protein